MFERFPERARQVIVLARHKAARHRRKHAATEHILLDLVRERGGVAARVLREFDAACAKIRNDVVRMVGDLGARKARR